MEIIATAAFGLEAVVKREIENLGYKIVKSEDAKITFYGDESAVVRANLWLRSADRVLLKIGEFSAVTFEELFQAVKGLEWYTILTEDANFSVNGTSVKSKLFSISDCQSIIEKAIVEKLKSKYKCERFSKTGAEYKIRFTILKDNVTISIDTSGTGLHKRGYRVKDVVAPIKETLAAALVQLSFWKEGRVLYDPLCGSGTIGIEAAMIGKNIAPGLLRTFSFENWGENWSKLLKQEKKEAYKAIKSDANINIHMADIDSKAIDAVKENVAEAGVLECIKFERAPFKALKAENEYGIIITNPPYGERIGQKDQLLHLYKEINSFIKLNPTWSIYLITADKEFEYKISSKRADRKRKLYNGRIETTYFQYYGVRPKKEIK